MAAELLETLKEAITGLSPNAFFTLLATGIAVYFIVSVLFRGTSDQHQQHRPMSSEQNRSTESSSSSSHSVPASISQLWNHGVFLSFRGEDTRTNFVDHLYTRLVERGIQTYKDDETLARGESIGPTLLKAIQESRIAVIVFSKNYADSSWCLDELAHIIECMDTRGQIVKPIFYHVDPSDVRKQRGKYGKAIKKHQRDNKQKVESWRKALEKAGNISGWTINACENSYESKCIKDIVDTISNRLPTLSTKVNKNLIGIETRLQNLKSKLEVGSDGVRIVGIWGVGGGGKTTLASAAFEELSHQFEAHCFLQNIREETKKHGLKKLQQKFLSLVLRTEYVRVWSEIEGRSMIERRLGDKSVLVVLDDVDDLEQVEALAGSREWFGKGSKIIITTRDEHLLTRHADTIYEVSLLSHVEAIKLFNKHAYRKDKPIEDYEMLSQDVVSYAGGLPLALEILGSFLYDKDKDEWVSALAKLKRIPNVKVLERLKISYDGLEPGEKELFLDIACFLRRWVKERAMKVLDACSYDPVIGVKVLVQKSLIKISNGKFDMHDLVEEMAHYIVRGEPPNHPEKQNRIWQEKDILEICATRAETLMENNHIEVLALPSYIIHPDLPRIGAMKAQNVRLSKLVASQLPSYVRHPHLPGVVANMKKLRWLYWEGYPASSFPSNFHPTKLGCLMLIRGQQIELWKGCKDLPNLKILDLRYSFNLTRTPDFNGLPCLETLILEDCIELEEIHPSIGHHERLVLVNMKGCSKLKMFPPIIKMEKLETLELSSCRELQKFPDIKTSMGSLANLHLDRTSIEIIPASVGQFCTNLVSFDLSYCQKLKRIDANLHLLESLKDLNLSFSSKLLIQHFLQDGSVSLKLPPFLRKLYLRRCNLGDGDIPSDICELLNLQELDLSCNKFSHLPSSITRLPCLKLLNLSRCKSLEELLALPSSIAILIADECASLENVGDLSNYKWLWKASFSYCNESIGKRVLHSMLKGNAVKDRFMSVILPNVTLLPERSNMPFLVTLQLPHNWYSDFSGFLFCGDYNLQFRYNIVIKHEECMDSKPDQWEEFHKNWESYGYARAGYVPFSSLRHTSWWNSTYTNVSFQIYDMIDPKVVLVPRRSNTGDVNELLVNYSECWDEEYEDEKTFKIIDDSRSSSVEIEWYHQGYLF